MAKPAGQIDDGLEGQVELAVDYRASPVAIAGDRTLSFESRVLLTWLFQHGSGWKFIIGFALKTLGISQSTWKRRVRKELIERGFFIQRRRAGAAGASGFRWSNVFTDKPLRLWCQNEPIQTEPIQNVRIQDDTNTKTLIVNKVFSKQKRESSDIKKPALSCLEDQKPAPPAQGAPATPPRWSADKNKEERDLAYARRIGESKGLSAAEIDAAINECRYPSEAPAAVEAVVKSKAAALAAAAGQAGLEKVKSIIKTDPASLAAGNQRIQEMRRRRAAAT